MSEGGERPRVEQRDDDTRLVSISYSRRTSSGWREEQQAVRTDLRVPRSMLPEMIEQLLHQEEDRVVLVAYQSRASWNASESGVTKPRASVRLYASRDELLSGAVLGEVVEQIVATLSAARSRAAPPTRDAALTPRELTVLEGLAKGLSAKQLSTGLNLSTHTVKTLKARIFSKLQVSNSAGAVAKGLRDGLLSDEDHPATRAHGEFGSDQDQRQA